MRNSILRRAAVRVIFGVPTAALLLLGAWTSVRLSRADWLFRRNRVESVRQAAVLDPLNGRYQAWLAELLENEGEDSTAALDEAARLNPMDSRVWIRRGLNAEFRGDNTEAERLLLHAAEMDRLYEPRWALANFYFRRGDEDHFWVWAHRAFNISYGDRTALFDLCWRMRDDAQLIASRALPPDDPLLMQFLRFLAARGRTEQAAVIATALAPRAAPAEKGTFLELIQRLLDAGQAEAALNVWNALCARGMVPHAALDPAAGRSLTNGAFAVFPTGAGFDWRYPATAGTAALREDSPAGLRVSLNGHQPDSCEILRQVMPVEPGRRYRLDFAYGTAGLPEITGVSIRSGEAATDLRAGEGQKGELVFASGAGRLMPLTVEYRRPSGQVRAEGTITLRDFRLRFAE